MATQAVFQIINHPADGQWHIERDGVTVGFAFPRRDGGWLAGLFAVDAGSGILLTKRAVTAWARRQLEVRA